jgi:uncharacterized membrane protein YqhA
MPGKFFSLRRITAVFTFMGLLPACFALISQGFVKGFPFLQEFFPSLTGLFSLAARIPVSPAAALVIALIDAFFLAYLVLFREDAECT